MENSYVWEYFIKKTADTAACKLCPKIIACKGKSTSGLIRHLKFIHKKPLEKEQKDEEPPQKIIKTQTTLERYSQKKGRIMCSSFKTCHH